MLILLLAGVLGAWFIQHIIYKTRWDKKLDVELSFMEPYAYEEDVSYLKQEITNAKNLPLPALEVRFSTSRNLEMQGEARENTSVSDFRKAGKYESYFYKLVSVCLSKIFCLEKMKQHTG